MEPQTIEIKSEFKAHEILAVCLHFYNQGLYINEVDNWYGSPTKFKFLSINSLLNDPKSNFTVNYETPDGGKYEFRFTNDKGDYRRPPKVNIMFKYDYHNWLTHVYKFGERKWNDYIIDKCEIKSGTTKVYDFNNSDEKEKYFESQDRMIRKLKFYDEYSGYLLEPLKNSNQSRLRTYSFDYINGFKQYIDNIIKYMEDNIVDYDSLTSLLNCVVEDMVDGVTYGFKVLRFRKNNYNSFAITLNKSFQLTVFVNDLRRSINERNYGMLDSAFKIIVPIFEKIGGVNELRNVILHNRILTE